MNKLKNKGLPVYWGVIISFFLIVMALLVYIAKINIMPGLQLGILIGAIISGIYSCCKEYLKLNPEADSKELFFNGFRTTALVTLIMIAFGLIMLWALPSIQQNMINQYQNELMKDSSIKDVPEKVAEYKSRFVTLFIGLNMMPIVLTGLIGSFLISILLKRK